MRNLHLIFDHPRCKFLRMDAYVMAYERDDKYPDNKSLGLAHRNSVYMELDGYAYSLAVYHTAKTVVVTVYSKAIIKPTPPKEDVADMNFD